MKLKIRKFSDIDWESGLASQLISVFIIFAAFIMYLWCLELCHTYICAAKTQTKLDSLIDGMAASSLEVSALDVNGVTQSGNTPVQFFNPKKVENYLLNYEKIINDLTNSRYDVDFEFDKEGLTFNSDGTVLSNSAANYLLSVNETNSYGDMKFDFTFSGINMQNKEGNNASISGTVDNTFDKVVFSGRVKYRGKARIDTTVDLVSSMNDILSYPDDIRKHITPYTAQDTSGVNNYRNGLNRLITVVNQLNVMNRKRYAKPINEMMVSASAALNKSAYFIRDIVSAYVGNSDSAMPDIENSPNGCTFTVEGGENLNFIDFLNKTLIGGSNLLNKNEYYTDLKLVYDGIDNTGIKSYNDILKNLNAYIKKGLLVIGYVEEYSDDKVSFERQYFVVTPTIAATSEEFKQSQKIEVSPAGTSINYIEYYLDISELTASDNISITYVGNDIAENDTWFAGENGENVLVKAEILKNAKVYILNYDKLFPQ